jgi:hypothetical protein
LQRDWLAQALDAKLHEPGKRFVLLTAEPGAGKSAFMAQLAHDHPDWLRYFIRRDQRSVLADVSDKGHRTLRSILEVLLVNGLQQCFDYVSSLALSQRASLT